MEWTVSAEKTPRRQTPTERLHEVTMATLGRRPSEPESSVTITRNAKGVAQFEVTVRSADYGEAQAAARRLFDALCSDYPYPATNGGAE